VEIRLDFLFQPQEARGGTRQPPPSPKAAPPAPDIQVPREVSTWAARPAEPTADEREKPASFPKAVAALPVAYITEARHRIEIHRNLAQAADANALRGLRNELRDRFGPLPAPAELLFKVMELKLAAAGRNISAIETKGGKLMLTRNHDYIMLDGKFPRLKRTTPAARLNEIRKLLLWM
jgi:transcription-repair coupling factor (superfamily II helicase)